MQPSRYLIYDTRTQQPVFTAQPLRTRTIARQVRREVARLTGHPTRFITVPGPDHKKFRPLP